MIMRLMPGPLYHFDRDANEFSDEWTGDFFLDSSLYIEDNTLLNIIGDEYDGNVNRFFLVSGHSVNIYIYIMAPLTIRLPSSPEHSSQHQK